MTDFLFLEEIHEMIKGALKPRVMHKKGVCASGYFRPYISLGEYTESEIFNLIDQVTPVSIRFSAMLGDSGTPDSRRNIKCMSLKFHDTNGDYDMISQSIPVFFINDVHDFKALADAFTVNTAFDGINREAAWRFILEHPESANCFLRMFSYEGLLDSFIYAKWFSVNSCVWVNSYDKRRNVRYKWVPVTKMVHKKSNNKTRINAEFMSGFDPEVAGTELRDALLTGDFPQYHLIVQIALKETEDKNTICWDDEKNVEEIEAGVLKITSLEDKELNFDIGRIVKGIMPKEDDFIKYMTFAHRLGCAERGHKV